MNDIEQLDKAHERINDLHKRFNDFENRLAGRLIDHIKCSKLNDINPNIHRRFKNIEQRIEELEALENAVAKRLIQISNIENELIMMRDEIELRHRQVSKIHKEITELHREILHAKVDQR